VLTCTMWG